jgi:short subunit dehydrogenase-like uncharacterized protein
MTSATQSRMAATYLIYGANGYTGELIAREAKARGQAPILGGRNAAALAGLADELGFSHRVFGLDDPTTLDAALAGAKVVLNCAGPFSRTARPMVDACLRNRVHYVDVTGEVEVFEALAARDADATASGVVVLPGAGFDVVPSDCLAAHLKRRLPSATHLALGFQALSGVSRGTAITTIEGMGKPNLVRRDGVLTEVPMGASSRTVDFGRGPVTAISIPWGDVSTAYYSTGIPNIDVFVGLPSIMKHVLKWNGRLAPLLRSSRLQGWLASRVRAGRAGPTAEQRERGRSYLWGEARDAAGTTVSSRLQTPEGYALTVLTALATVDKLLAGMAQPGFLTPSKAFGPDFILEIPGTVRSD